VVKALSAQPALAVYCTALAFGLNVHRICLGLAIIYYLQVNKDNSRLEEWLNIRQWLWMAMLGLLIFATQKSTAKKMRNTVVMSCLDKLN
jgi:hypothetical protein